MLNPNFLFEHRNRYSEGTDDAQKTPRGHPYLNSYVQNLRVFIFRTDGRTDGRRHSFLQPGTVGDWLALRFFQIVALVHKKTYVERTKYVRKHTPATASSRQPQTTNKRTMAEARGFCYHDISFISWPNIMFETRKSIRSICSCHPLNLFCIGGLRLQFFYEGCLKLARS